MFATSVCLDDFSFNRPPPLPFPLLIIPSCRKSPSRSFNQTCFLRTFFFTHPYYANLRCFNRKFLVWFWEVAVKKIYSWVLGGCNLEFWLVKDSSPPGLLKMLNFKSQTVYSLNLHLSLWIPERGSLNVLSWYLRLFPIFLYEFGLKLGRSYLLNVR